MAKLVIEYVSEINFLSSSKLIFSVTRNSEVRLLYETFTTRVVIMGNVKLIKDLHTPLLNSTKPWELIEIPADFVKSSFAHNIQHRFSIGNLKNNFNFFLFTTKKSKVLIVVK